jgi:hypothetical protein
MECFTERDMDGVVASKEKCRRRLSLRKEKSYLQTRGSSLEAAPDKVAYCSSYVRISFGPLVL